MAGSKKKIAKSIGIFDVVICVFFVLVIIVTVYPLINMAAYSFSERYDAMKGHIFILPRKFDLRNYKEVIFERVGTQTGFAVTIARTVIGTATSLAVNALLAFILSRRKSRFRSLFSLFWIITMYVQGGIVPTYILYGKLGLTGSFLVYIIPGMVNVMHVLVMRTYMRSIPDSLEESALLEGAGYGKIFIDIISPLCKPVYTAVALFIATYHWNSWFDAFLYNKFKPKLTTIQFEIYKMNQELRMVSNDTVSAAGERSYPLTTIKAATIILTVIPVLIAYPFFQKYFVSGLTVGGVKE